MLLLDNAINTFGLTFPINSSKLHFSFQETAKKVIEKSHEKSMCNKLMPKKISLHGGCDRDVSFNTFKSFSIDELDIG